MNNSLVLNYLNTLIPVNLQAEIKDTLDAIETGSLIGDYSNITIYDDGEDNTRQITYGKSQTTEQGNLKSLISMYINNHGQYSDFFKPYLSKIGNRATPLVDDKEFLKYLKLAGKDPIMMSTQDIFFDQVYFIPACLFFQMNKFTLPLSLLVIYDSYVHSGTIFDFLRNKFVEKTPVYGGDEKKWIESYVKVRNEWLLSSPKKLLRNSAYRTKCFLEQINNNNWDLSKPYVVNDVKIP